MKHNIYILILLSLVFTSCERYDFVGMFSGSSPAVNERFTVSALWNEKHPQAPIVVQDSTYSVYVATDSHVDTTNYNLSQFVSDYRSDAACPLAVHLGDLIDASGHYPLFVETLSTPAATPLPYKKDTLLLVCGNHDLYFGQWREFKDNFHTSCYWVETTYNDRPLDLYIVLDSGSGTLGTKQLAWLRKLLKERSRLGYRHIIVLTHTNFYKQDASQGICSNFAMEETYELCGLMQQFGVSMVWNGHDHCREVTHYGNTTYITVDSMKDRDEQPYYMIASVGDQISYRFVPLHHTKTSAR